MGQGWRAVLVGLGLEWQSVNGVRIEKTVCAWGKRAAERGRVSGLDVR